jgi:hypothetical protein
MDKFGNDYEGLLGARVCGGYGSKLGDCSEYEFDLCEDCLDKLFDEFEIDPLVKTMWDEDEEQQT